MRTEVFRSSAPEIHSSASALAIDDTVVLKQVRRGYSGPSSSEIAGLPQLTACLASLARHQRGSVKSTQRKPASMFSPPSDGFAVIHHKFNVALDEHQKKRRAWEPMQRANVTGAQSEVAPPERASTLSAAQLRSPLLLHGGTFIERILFRWRHLAVDRTRRVRPTGFLILPIALENRWLANLRSRAAVENEPFHHSTNISLMNSMAYIPK